MWRGRCDLADALIGFQDVALGYDGVPVLEGLVLDVHRGDFLALVGPIRAQPGPADLTAGESKTWFESPFQAWSGVQ